MQKKFLTTQCNLFQLKNVMVSYDLRPKSVHLSFDIIAYILVQSILINCNCDIGYFDVYISIHFISIHICNVYPDIIEVRQPQGITSITPFVLIFIYTLNECDMNGNLAVDQHVCLFPDIICNIHYICITALYLYTMILRILI